MEDGNLAILVEAKTEYTKQLVNIISPNIYLGIKKIYNESKESCNNNNDNDDDVLCQFQKDLSEIPKWNQEVINDECDLLIENSKCDWLDDLLTAVFVSHTRILTSINFNKNKNKINLKIPKVDHFVHLCFIEIARHFWKNPYLFDDSISKFEYQRNRRDAEKIIDNTINETIRKQLPVKHILKEYLGNEFKDTKLEDETINETTDNENLRKMVKAEIENCSKEKLKKLNINSDENIDLMEDDSLLDINDEFKLDEPSKDTPSKDISSESPPSKDISSESPPSKDISSESPPSKDISSESPPSKDISSESPPSKDISSESPPSKDISSESPPSKDISSESPPSKDISSESAPSKDISSESPPSKDISSESPPSKDISSEVDDKLSELDLTISNKEKSINIQSLDKDINDMIDNEVNNLKIETLNLDFDDLQNLEEIYIDEPKIEKLDITENKNKIKTVYIETEENKDDKVKKHSKNDFNFF